MNKLNENIEKVSQDLDNVKTPDDLTKSIEEMGNKGIMREFISKFVNLTNEQINQYVKKISTKGILIIQNMIEVVPVFGEIFAFIMIILNGITIGLDTTQLGIRLYNVLNKKYTPLLNLIKKFMQKVIEINKKIKQKSQNFKNRFTSRRISRFPRFSKYTVKAPIIPSANNRFIQP